MAENETSEMVGWIVFGGLEMSEDEMFVHMIRKDEDLEQLLTRFWEMDEIPVMRQRPRYRPRIGRRKQTSMKEVESKQTWKEKIKTSERARGWRRHGRLRWTDHDTVWTPQPVTGFGRRGEMEAASIGRLA